MVITFVALAAILRVVRYATLREDSEQGEGHAKGRVINRMQLREKLMSIVELVKFENKEVKLRSQKRWCALAVKSVGPVFKGYLPVIGRGPETLS